MSELSNPKSGIKYRPDIDGLRAVAVLSVLAFHMEVRRLNGGYVGVDVFFVISGYLISAIVFSEIAGSRFSIAGFYERRIRRIFPALFGMLIAFSVVASIYLLPTEFVGYSKSLLAATLSASNFYFWLHSGYFDSPTSSPLLHTWSLAVEEQFYILFPIFLVLVRRLFPKRMRTAVVILFFVSLAASVAIVPSSAETAFYMPYTRAWELLLGTIVSQRMFPRMQSSLMRNLATLAGAALIAYPVVIYTKETPFPGLAALPPCIGSALIIGAGEFGPSVVSRVLSWRPVVFIGLISYSLYLWHWPVIIMHAMGLSVNLNQVLPHRFAAMLPIFRIDMVMEILASFVLAILSWRFVERPFRSRPLRVQRRPLFAMSAAVMAVLIAFSITVIQAGGFKGRFSPQSVGVASFLDKREFENLGAMGKCLLHDQYHFTDFNPNVCLQVSTGKRNYLLLGDSHAAALWGGLASTLPGDNILLAAAGNCKPFVEASGSADCKQLMNLVYKTYLPQHPVDGILLEARWKAEDIGGLTATIAWARGHQLPVTLFGPVPEYDAPEPRLLAYSLAWNKLGMASEHRLPLPAAMDAELQAQAATTWHLHYISLYQALCGSGNCVEYADSEHRIPLMNDADHLNEYGSVFVVKRLFDQGKLM